MSRVTRGSWAACAGIGLLLVVGLVGCGGSSSAEAGPDIILADYSFTPDVPLPPDVPQEVVADVPIAIPEQGLLAFVDAQGDGGFSCVGYNHCTKLFQSVEVKALKVKYTEDDRPVKGAKVRFTIGDDQLGQAKLEPQNGLGITDENGQASVNLRITSVEAAAQFFVEVEVLDRKIEVQHIFFDIVVDPKGKPPLTVLPEYRGARRVRSVELKLYRHPEDPAHPGQYLSTGVTCAELVRFVRTGDEIHMPSADVAPREVAMGASAVYENDFFENLVDDGAQMYTILAVGGDNDVDLAVGCDDTNGLVEAGRSKSVVVAMADLPPRLAGDYLVTSEFDLITALPANVGEVVYHIINLFQSPADEVLTLLCLIEVDVMNQLCEYVYDAQGNPTVMGDIAITIINGIINGLTAGNIWGDILHTGADVGQILTNLTFVSMITIKDEPLESGELTSDMTYEEWSTIRYRWTLGISGCAADPDCGWNEFSFRAVALKVVEAEFEGRVNTVEQDGHAPYTLLTIDPHAIDIKYGALVNYIVKNVILPMLAGDGSDGNPRIDEYAELIKSIVAGRECLLDEVSGGPTCCNTFATNLVNEAGGVSVTLVESACTALVDYGSKYIEDLLVGLDLETGETFRIGTKTPCVLYDANNDLRIDSMGKADRKCTWDANIRVNVGGGLDVHIDADFVGTRQ